MNLIDLHKIQDSSNKQVLIDRLGKIHSYEDYEDEDVVSFHYEIAAKLLPKSDDPLDELMKLGYVLTGSRVTRTYSLKPPTQAQLNTLYDLGFTEVKEEGNKYRYY